MFGLISAGVQIAGLGMSAIQAIQENRRMAEAKASTNAALNAAQNLTEQNAFKATKAADVSSYQEGKIAQNLTQGVDTLAQTGAEGAIGGTANALQAANDANLQATQAQGQANYERDLMVAGEQNRINSDAIKRQFDIYGFKAGQGAADYTDSSLAKTNAISGMASQGAGAIAALQADFDPATGQYKDKEWYANNPPKPPTGNNTAPIPGQ